MIGAQIGYNIQKNNLVFGIYGDISYLGMDDTLVKPSPSPATFEFEYNYMATLQGRAGYLMNDSTLLYGHGGFALADIDLTETSGSGPWAGLSQGDTELGIILGVGIEKRFSDKISGFIEYSYVDFANTLKPRVGPPGQITLDSQIQTIKIGVNFQLGK